MNIECKPDQCVICLAKSREDEPLIYRQLCCGGSVASCITAGQSLGALPPRLPRLSRCIRFRDRQVDLLVLPPLPSPYLADLGLDRVPVSPGMFVLLT